MTSINNSKLKNYSIKRNLYSGDFYSLRNKETKYAADKILAILLKKISSIKTAIDVGCGVGTFLSVLSGRGVEDILGLDGDWVDYNELVIPQSKFQIADLRNYPILKKKYDLAICLEVAEHLPAENAEKFIKWLCISSDVILFSAAVPKQGGVNHINEAWQSYWADLFSLQGFEYADLIRPQIWNDKKISFWYRQNILVYIRKGNQLSLDKSCELPLDLIHPELYLMKSDDSYFIVLLKRLLGKLKYIINRFK